MIIAVVKASNKLIIDKIIIVNYKILYICLHFVWLQS